MSRLIILTAATAVALLASVLAPTQSRTSSDGRSIFRFDTFGDEQLWTDTLRMQAAVKKLSPNAALSVGLKVDSDALPKSLIRALRKGQVNLDDPAVTLELLKLDAIVGIKGKVVGPNDKLASIGITCALCHSTVDDAVAPGIGHRLDGWPNRTLNVGAIIALSPVVTDKKPFESWGPGKYDPRFQIFNGQQIVRLHKNTLPVVIPPAFGLQGVGFETFTGDGPISYWNNYVGVTQMGGHGSFRDPRIGIRIRQRPDLVRPKLDELLDYQLSLQTPPPPEGSFDKEAARRGKELFNGAAGCARCHVPPLFTDVNLVFAPPFLHAPSEVGQEPVYARRSATNKYRTTPLRALWQHPPYFHDGSAKNLRAVVEHYNSQFGLGLSKNQKADLVEYLKTL
jgi:hypothetical protein